MHLLVCEDDMYVCMVGGVGATWNKAQTPICAAPSVGEELSSFLPPHTVHALFQCATQRNLQCMHKPADAHAGPCVLQSDLTGGLVQLPPSPLLGRPMPVEESY